MILERAVQRIANGKYEAYQAYEKKWAEVEQRMGGFPTKRHLMLLSGSMALGTQIWEREWADMATMETCENRYWSDPEVMKLMSEDEVIVEEEWREFFFVQEF